MGSPVPGLCCVALLAVTGNDYVLPPCKEVAELDTDSTVYVDVYSTLKAHLFLTHSSASAASGRQWQYHEYSGDKGNINS